MSSVFDPLALGPPVERGGFEMRLARNRSELQQLQRLRARSFRGDESANDADRHDARSRHLWIARPGEPPLATLRLSHHLDAQSLLAGYSAGFFDLEPIARLQGTALELGRLCLRPQAPTAEVMRLIWTGIARMTIRSGAQRLIGCTSLDGADPARHRALLAQLAVRHLGPPDQRPAARGPGASGFGHLATQKPAPAPPRLPPILRFYMSLGGWVSDQLAIDTDLNTCLLFTCVEVAAMPASRRQLLRALATEKAGSAGA
ncbi:MAG: GNAT family N-acetyltransferase [Pararhodobacter sp.]|nr:GNAT family N-acetyltransferase [Pararhodobacter sp.]